MVNNKSHTSASQATLSQRQLTDVELAEYLHISVSTVRRWRLTGDGPRWIRIGGSVRYPIADLEAYVAGLPSGGWRRPPP